MRSRAGHYGFTLIELLVIIGIIGVMVSVAVVNITAGQDGARIKGAARNVFATIRYARSRALASQQPVIITYSTATVDGVPSAKIDINSTSLAHAGAAEPVERLYEPDGDCAPPVKIMPQGAGDDSDPGDGSSLYDFPSLPGEVVAGMRLKVLKEGEELETSAPGETRRRRISVFSTTSALMNQFESARQKQAAEKKEEEAAETAESAPAADAATEEPVSIVWEVNGRTEPHRVWVYPDGSRPENGLCIKIDQFGAAKILGDGEDGD